MEILHKKANTMPAPLSTVRADVSAQLEALIMRAMAKDPAERPPSMEALERELQNIATLLFSNFNSMPLAEPDPSPPAGVLGALPGVAVAGAGGLVARVRGWDRRTKAVVAAGAAVGLALAFIWVGRASHGRGKTTIVETVATAPAPVVAPPPPVVAPAAPVTPPPSVEKATVENAAAENGADEDATEATEAAGKVDEDTDGAGKTKTPRVAAAAGGENKKLLAEAQRMLRAERFAEARGLFEKLAKSKRERGQALVGLAEISFQEKKYADAARAAELAADRGGGVKAHVLLGDAHFRLARYKEAAKAYESALRIDPGNASAKSGLALANKRM
jgi:tetratricopeptide (TPR) repeat protein